MLGRPSDYPKWVPRTGEPPRNAAVAAGFCLITFYLGDMSAQELGGH